ncbi:MAG: dTDP-4-dehydrorhamnose 3,5-epimerase [Gammaproteobacteria bacterium]|nr:dTDP-4-dehydrorhamnose 3,5-epimerase [Gammaproteobacteria bacterium]
MQFIATTIPEVMLVIPQVFGDSRGFFMETYHQAKFAAGGITANFVQDNHSRSVQGTLRGLHYQIAQTQGKLVRVTRGEVFDVAVDIRRSSPTFGQWVGEILSEDNQRQLWVPPGFAHGFYVISEVAEFTYKCSDLYAPQYERSIRWDDPDLAIKWPLIANMSPLLSAKDLAGLPLGEAELFA